MYNFQINMKVVVISGSPRENANTEIMMKHVVEYVEEKDVELKFINLSEGGFEYYRGWVDDYNEKTLQAAKDIMAADVWLIGTPIYNSSNRSQSYSIRFSILWV